MKKLQQLLDLHQFTGFTDILTVPRGQNLKTLNQIPKKKTEQRKKHQQQTNTNDKLKLTNLGRKILEKLLVIRHQFKSNK